MILLQLKKNEVDFTEYRKKVDLLETQLNKTSFGMFFFIFRTATISYVFRFWHAAYTFYVFNVMPK